MTHRNWCRKPCADCSSPCALDESIPCSPDCDNVNDDGTLYLSGCINAKCDNIANYAYCDGELKDPTDCEETCPAYKGCVKIELAETIKDTIRFRKN
jgi:hypothetical protein